MSKENIIYNSFRLNMNNPEHVRIQAVLSNLNNHIYKSKNQFIAEAILYYIDHYGAESFTKEEDSEVHFITKEELEGIRKDMLEEAATEARKEVIKVLGGVISGMQTSGNMTANTNHTQQYEAQTPEENLDDEVVSGWAMKWMNGEGDASE